MRGSVVLCALVGAVQLPSRSAAAQETAPDAAAPAAPAAPAAAAPAVPAPAPAAPAAAAAAPAAAAAAPAAAAPAPATTAPPPATTAPPLPGIVRLERGAHRLGFGVVLRSDGRILSALSALGHGNYLHARFADDHVLGVRVVKSDRAWDLALLAPEGGFWSEGLRASSLDPVEEGVRLRRFGGRGRDVSESPATIKGRQVLLGRDGAVLEDALLLGSNVADDELGSPICDAAGDVIALVGQACDPANRQDCRLTPYGVPISAIKHFLKGAPARDPLPAAWVGLRGVASHSGSVGGVRVIVVDPGSPAELAGLRAAGPSAGAKASEDAAGDLIVAVAGAPVTTPEELRDAINRVALTGASGSAAAGSSPTASAVATVRLLVYGAGKFREVDLPLRAPVQIPAPR